MGDFEEDDEDNKDNSKGTAAETGTAEVIQVLTSLCSAKNASVPFCDQVVYGIDGAVVKKEKSFQRHYNGNIGRVYLLDHLEKPNGYKVGWVLDDAYPDCMVCSESFEFLSRSRHHCRSCGLLVCDECSKDRASIAELSNNSKHKWRVCDLCCTLHPPNKIWHLNAKS